MARTFAEWLQAYMSDDAGATAIEYAIIATFVFLGLVPLIRLMGEDVGLMYNEILSYFAAVGA
jgi:Flp pilus assembly pilin Flp